MIRKILLVGLFGILLTPLLVSAGSRQPHWTLEMNGGVLNPADKNWSTYYGSNKIFEVGGSIAYRLLYVLDLGLAADYGQDKGVGFLPQDDSLSGSVTYRILPVELFALLRLRFTEGQWLVPYAGGGYTRFAYHITVSDQGTTRGSVNGIHARAGLQLLLDPLDSSSAKEMLRSFGAVNSYLYFEFKRTRAEAGSPAFQIGGDSFKTGLMVEFR